MAKSKAYDYSKDKGRKPFPKQVMDDLSRWWNQGIKDLPKKRAENVKVGKMK